MRFGEPNLGWRPNPQQEAPSPWSPEPRKWPPDMGPSQWDRPDSMGTLSQTLQWVEGGDPESHTGRDQGAGVGAA